MKTPTKTIKNIEQEYKVTPVRKRATDFNQNPQQIRPEESTPAMGQPLIQSTSKPTHKKSSVAEEKSSRSTTKKVSFMQFANSENQDEDPLSAYKNGSRREVVLEEIDQNRQPGKNQFKQDKTAAEQIEQAKVSMKHKGDDQSSYSSSIKMQKVRRVQQKDNLSDTGKKERMVKALKHLCEDVEFEI